MSLFELKNKKLELLDRLTAEAPGDERLKASFEIGTRQAKEKLAKLDQLITDTLYSQGDFYLITGAGDLELVEDIQKKGHFAADHLGVARRIAANLFVEMTPGKFLTPQQLGRVDRFLDTIANECGLKINTALHLKASYLQGINDKEALVNTVEALIEENLRNKTEKEGHLLQAYQVHTTLLNQLDVSKSGPDGKFPVFVFVPDFSKDLINTYVNQFKMKPICVAVGFDVEGQHQRFDKVGDFFASIVSKQPKKVKTEKKESKE